MAYGKIREICTIPIVVSVVRIVSGASDSEISNTAYSILSIQNETMRNWSEK